MAKTKQILILAAISAADALLKQFPFMDLVRVLGTREGSKGVLGDIARDPTHVSFSKAEKSTLKTPSGKR